jgi:hypothetical protein
MESKSRISKGYRGSKSKGVPSDAGSSGRIVRDTIKGPRQVDESSSSQQPILNKPHHADTRNSSPKKKSPLAMRKPNTDAEDDEDEGYGEDDFEDYDEDFEDEDEQNDSKADEKHTLPVQNYNQSKVKETESDVNSLDLSSASIPKVKPTLVPKPFKPKPMMAPPLGDPRAKRIKALYDNNILDMREESVSVLNILPSTSYEHYHRNLRSQDPTIKQMGTPNDEESRTVDTNTDEIVMIDKEMQFTYGDDTVMLNVMRAIDERRKNGVMSESLFDTVDRISGPGGIHGIQNVANDASTTQRLGTFLQKASLVCDRLLQEKKQRSEEYKADKGDTDKGIFNSDRPWISLGTDLTNGSIELIRARNCVSMCFSPLQPSLLITSHPSVDDEEDLKPSRGLYCLWDVSSPEAPYFIMESSGVPTCACFSGSQTYIILAGTEEGALHLWDLREENHIHRDRDAIDLGIERGIRKPCYSSNRTCVPEMDAFDDNQHTSPISQVEPIAMATSAAVSQFASSDLSGKVILWVTTSTSTQTSNTDGGRDLGLSPWGRTRLLQSRVLNMGDARFSLGSVTSVLSVIPGDASTLLLSGPKGSLQKLVRFGNDPPSSSLQKSTKSSPSSVVRSASKMLIQAWDTSMEIQIESNEIGSSTENIPHADVSSISVGPALNIGKNIFHLVLVGRMDGSIDLYRSDIQVPIQTWSLEDSGKKTNILGRRVILTKWCPNRFTSFLAVDNFSEIHYFDLVKKVTGPGEIDTLPSESSPNSSACDISSTYTDSKIAYLAYSISKMTVSDGAMKVRRLRDGIVTAFDSVDAEVRLLSNQMATWMARTCVPRVKTTFTTS